MAKLYVMQTGRTTWRRQDRVETAAGTPLTEDGARAVQDVARQLAGMDIVAVYAGQGEAERQTAKLAAEILGLKVKTEGKLRDINYGLWQGLTVQEIKHRQPKRYRQWTQSPGTVSPPGGETLAEAQDRLRRAVKELAKKQKKGASLLVLRPLMAGLLRCMQAGGPLDDVWKHVDPEFTWQSYEIDGRKI